MLRSSGAPGNPSKHRYLPLGGHFGLLKHRYLPHGSLLGSRAPSENIGIYRSGATLAWFGDFWVGRGALGCIHELTGGVSGNFRSSEIDSWDPLSDRFEGTFDLRTGTVVPRATNKHVFVVRPEAAFGWCLHAWSLVALRAVE